MIVATGVFSQVTGILDKSTFRPSCYYHEAFAFPRWHLTTVCGAGVILRGVDPLSAVVHSGGEPSFVYVYHVPPLPPVAPRSPQSSHSAAHDIQGIPLNIHFPLRSPVLNPMAVTSRQTDVPDVSSAIMVTVFKFLARPPTVMCRLAVNLPFMRRRMVPTMKLSKAADDGDSIVVKGRDTLEHLHSLPQ